MEVQGFIPGLCSSTSIVTIQYPQKRFLLTLHSSSTPSKSSSLRWSHDYVCFKTLQSFPPRAASFKILECVNTAEVLGSVISEKEYHNKPEVKRKKLAVFVSGGGSNFKSIHDACLRGSIHGDIVAVVTNKQGCGGAEYARSNEIPVLLFPRTKDDRGGLSPTDLVNALRDLKVDFVLLAGYLKLIPTELIRTALLPAFGGKGYYGMKVHKAVIASGVRYSGPTIHFVDEHYDTGRILAQSVVPVLADNTPEELAARVLREEHRLYVEVVMALCEERITWREGRWCSSHPL